VRDLALKKHTNRYGDRDAGAEKRKEKITSPYRTPASTFYNMKIAAIP